KMATWCKDDILDLATKAGLSTLADSIQSTYEALRDPDEGKSMLQILKESPSYAPCDNDTVPLFTYTPANDPGLTLSREYFNIDSIAGNGDDVSRIKNLLYWVHEAVRHDGSSSWPDCHFNLRELVQVCRDQNRGLNCRFMAMMLTEALLSQGIPARYITCQSKAWDEDNDCHVICVAWAGSLDKWVWVDPTFAAFVTDENGLMLHPGEVRYRLQHDLPLILNDDANWNHEIPQTKEGYLEEYMAKNLYIMSACSIQQSEPEGKSEHEQGYHIALTPLNSNYNNSRIIITDDTYFWQTPSYHE
ncbi:MAG: transglutaminase-like domain-containing protein, partial [Muribaculaceae bacterium]|nr:transglutaminase-like domain-containing protein [Muribaculaceae bacterium]